MDDQQYQMDHIDDDRTGSVIAGVVICGIISYSLVALRMYAHRSASLRVDDWILLGGLIVATGQYVDFAIGILWGLGRHMILLTDYTNAGRNLISSGVLYVWAISLVKLSILVLWSRLFVDKRTIIAIKVTGALVMILTVSSTLIVVLQCIPIQHLWDHDVPASCIDMGGPVTIYGSLNVLTDILVILIPVKSLWKLQLKRKEKLQLIGLFLTGGLVVLISTVRLFYTIRINQDMTWSYVDAGIWSSAEISAAIVSACLPTLRPLFKPKRPYSGRTSRSIYEISERSAKYKASQDEVLPLSELAKPSPVVWKKEILR